MIQGVAHRRAVFGEVELHERREICADAVVYQDLDALIASVREANPALTQFETSCFDGRYITGDVTMQDILRLNEQRVQTPDDSADASRLALPNAS